MTDDEWQALHEGFDTHRLLDAVDDLDTLRQALSDDGLKPPEIRDRLLQLHQLAMAVINEGSQDEAGELFDLALELEDEAFEIMEAATRLHEALSTLSSPLTKST
jgi:hypothetical protein